MQSLSHTNPKNIRKKVERISPKNYLRGIYITPVLLTRAPLSLGPSKQVLTSKSPQNSKT